MGLLLCKLREIQYEARHLAIKLGLNNINIETVGEQYNLSTTPHEFLQRIFSLWLKQPSHQRTWKILVQALRSSDEQVIADRIERMYTLDQSGMIDL